MKPSDGIDISSRRDLLTENFDSPIFSTSTPSNPNRRSGRRSWFDKNPGKGTKYEIAVEKKVKAKTVGRRKSEDEEEIETLILSHFTNPPRISFGKAKPGMCKTRTLIIKNPHEYPQNVKVERFPFKKHFTIDQTHFTVEAEDTLPVTVTWQPEEEGNFREMILFQIDSSYRLQAFVFGSVEKPPRKKKAMKKGLLSREIKKPFAVLQTPGLANIAKSYSPTKGERRHSSGNRKRLSGGRENKAPGPVKKSATSREDFAILKEKREQLPTDLVLDNSVIHLSQITPIKSTEDVDKGIGFVVPKVINFPSKNTVLKTGKETHEVYEPFSPLIAKYLDDEDDSVIVVPHRSHLETSGNIPEKVPLTCQGTPDKADSAKQNISEVKTPDKEENGKSCKRADYLSPNSFLQDSLCSQHGVNTSFLGVANSGDRQPAHSTVLPTPERLVSCNEPNKNFVSPNKFLKELNDTQEKIEQSLLENPATIPSPDSILNGSIPHEIMVKQLQTVKSSLVSHAPSPIFSPMFIDNKRETFICQSTKTHTQSPGLRRETFIKGKISTSVGKVSGGSTVKHSTFNHKEKRTIAKKENVKTSSNNVKKVNCNQDSEKEENSKKKGSSVLGKNIQESRNSDNLDGKIPESPFGTQVCNPLRGIIDTPEVLAINSATVTKERSQITVTPESRTSTGKKLFTPDTENLSPKWEHRSSVFQSPDCGAMDTPMRELFTRRATLTITKEKPSVSSDAVLQVKQKTALISTEDLDAAPNLVNTDVKCAEVVTPANKTAEKCLSKNNTSYTLGQSVELTPADGKLNANTSKTGSFSTTPYQLPNSPNPDHSRRSTHVIENPKVLDLTSVGRKRLFPPLEDADMATSFSEDEKEHNTDAPNKSEDGHPDSSLKNIAGNIETTTGVVLNEVEEMSHENEQIQNLNSAEKSVLSDAESKGIEKKEFPLHKDKNSPKVLKSEEDKDVTASDSNKPSVQFLSFSPGIQGREPVTVNRKHALKEVVKKRAHSESRMATETSTKRLKSTEVHQTGRNRAAAVPARLATRSCTASVLDRKMGAPKPPNQAKVAVKGIAQTKLILMKKTRPALPKHPLPFASKNMYYDERWIEKQERGFVHWLNFVLTPAEEYQHNNKQVKVDAGALCIESRKNNIKLAPTKEVLSIRAYTARRQLNRLRRSACNLFQTREIVHVVQKLEAEIESLRLVIRKDKKVHADLGMKQNILDMILSFNPLWLRIGLETVYGEMIPMQNNSDVIGMSKFIVTRLLGNPDIAMEYCHPSVPHLYRDGYAEAIAQHLLKKLFMLIFFLDKAKSHRLINHDPCLFCKDSEFKSTKAMLIHFSRNYLSGEGDVTKHLGYLGYLVTHQQTPMDEFDYAVTNLAGDLRDGVRLTRIIELLTNSWELSKRLRAPAVSRLQKVHNIEVVFRALAAQGVYFDKDKKITAKDIVDGHREKTLHVLWALILQYQVNVLLNEEQLKEEISILQKHLLVRNQLEALKMFEQGLSKKRRESEEPDLHMQNERLQTLLRWCRTVCAFYHIKIENFTVSFGDGRALCALVHHYHPALLPWTSVNTKTTLTYQDDLEEQQCIHNLDLNTSEVFSPAPFPVAEDPILYDQLLANEKANFKLLYEKVSELGGIPLMLRSIDMSNTIPDEKVVVTYISYLCARMLDIRHESRAARIIQLAWRRHYLKKSQEALELKNNSAMIIQKAVKKFLRTKQAQRYESGARIIQRHVRGWLARKRATKLIAAEQEKQRHQAACVIQHFARGYLSRQHFLRQQRAAVCIQCIVRGIQLRCFLRRRNNAACVIQRWYQSLVATKEAMEKFRQTRKAAVVIQTAYRSHRIRRDIRQRHNATVIIQSHYRGFVAHRKYQVIKSAAIKLQRWRRRVTVGRQVRSEFSQIKASVVKIQSIYKGHKTRSQFMALKHATVRIQAWVKGHQQRVAYRKLQQSVLVVQRRFRANKEGQDVRRHYLVQKGAAMTIQSYFRGHRVRQERKREHTAATVIGASVKCFIQRRKFLQLRNAALTIEKKFKAKLEGRRVRKEFLLMKGAAITIQAVYRARKVRLELARTCAAATIVQATFRSYILKKRFLNLRKAVLVIQKQFRAKEEGSRVRKEFLAMKGAAMTIQAYHRGHKVRKLMKSHRCAAIAIQAWVKGYQQRNFFRNLQQATVFLQRRFRANIQGREVRRCFLVQKGAAITIQAFYRGQKVRREMAKANSSAVIIQAKVKGYFERQKFLCLKNAASVIGQRFKARLEGRRARKEFLILKGAIMTIQALYRGHKVRQEITKAHLAATVIQAKVKGYFQRQKFTHLKNAALVVQQSFRGKVEGKKVRKEFLVKKGAAMTIQAFYRGHVVRKKISRLHRAATVIQSAYKACRASCQYKKQRRAVLYIQQWYRNLTFTRNIKANFQNMKTAAVTIQKYFRRHKAVNTFINDKSNVIKSQAIVKGFIQRRRYLKLRGAIVVIQQRFLAKKQCISARKEFLIKKGAAMTIQAVYRGHVVRKDLQRQHAAAVVLQSVYRTHRAVTAYRQQRWAVLVIQTWYRGLVYMQAVRTDYLNRQCAAVIIQKYYRCSVQRRAYVKDLSRIVQVQALVRGMLQRAAYRQVRRAVMVCQIRYRARKACLQQHSHYHRMRAAAIVLQSMWRKHTSQREYYTLKKAAILVQSYIRMAQQRKHFCQLKAVTVQCQRRIRAKLLMKKCQRNYMIMVGATITIQAYVRSYLVQKEYHRTCQSVKHIQACVRRFLAQKKFQRTQTAVVILQKRFRAWLIGNKQRLAYQNQRHAAITIQSAFRALKARQLVRGIKAAIMIQKTFKMYGARKKFLQLKCSAIVIQSHFRAYKARQVKSHYLLAVKYIQKTLKMYLFRQRLVKWMQTRMRAAVVIQSCYCGYRVRRCVQEVKAAIKLQSVYRMHIQKKRYLNSKRRIIQLQSLVRGVQARSRVKQIKAQHSAATCIQNTFRAYKRRQAEEELKRSRALHLKRFTVGVSAHLSAIKIQRSFRNHQALQVAKQRLHSIILIQRWMRAKLTRMKYLRFVHAVRVVQKHACQHLQHRQAAVIKLQAVIRGWLGRRMVTKRENAAILLQASWRGRQVRKNYQSKKFEKLRKGLKEATRTATEEKKLGNRTKSALDYLLKYKQLSHILEALVHLETSTRLSPACCQRMVDVNAVGVMYCLIQSCNRSQPHMEIIKYSINILLNLAKYEKTRSAVYEVEGAVDVLLELMQVYREKGFIFSCACTLVGILGMMDDYRKVVVADKKITSKMLSLYSLTARKHRITETRLIRQAKLTAAKSFNSTLPVALTQRKQHRIHPEWVLQKNKMRQIEDPLQAIKFVLDNFHLTPK